MASAAVQGAWLSVVHDSPAETRVQGAWLSVVHDSPAETRVQGAWLSVVHSDVAPSAPAAGIRTLPRGRGPMAGPAWSIT